MLRHPLLAPDLEDFLACGEAEAVREFLEEHEPPVIAEMLADLPSERAQDALGMLDPRTAAQVFSYFDAEDQERALLGMPPERAAGLLQHMPHDDRADLVARFDDEVIEPILRRLARAEREDIRRLASYEPGTAGAVMTTDYAALSARQTVREALEQLRREAPDRETIDPSFVVDHKRRLLGVVSLKTLVLSRPSKRIEEVMTDRNLITAQLDEDQEKVARKIAKYDLLALPVLDADHQLVGIVTHDDAVDILQREQTEDLLALTGVQSQADDADEGYWNPPVVTVVRRRVVWLVALFVSGMMTATVTDSFGGALGPELVALLSAFVPMLIGTGGNAGSQTVGTVIRGLVLEEIQTSDLLRVIRREGLTGLILGLLMGPMGMLFVVSMGRPLVAGLVVGLAIVGICLWANIVGAIVPLIAKRLNIDPAIVSAPMISTLVDVTGMIIYYGIALLILVRLRLLE